MTDRTAMTPVERKRAAELFRVAYERTFPRVAGVSAMAYYAAAIAWLGKPEGMAEFRGAAERVLAERSPPA